MTSAADVVRRRRLTRDRAAGALRWRTLALVVVALSLLTAGGTLTWLGRVLFAAAAEAPDVLSLESFFGAPGSERFRPAQLFDRTGETLLAEMLHPLAVGRRWETLDRLPESVPLATVAALDPEFWSGSTAEPLSVAARIVAGLQGTTFDPGPTTIPERLASQFVPADGRLAPMARLMVASELSASVPRERVLEWFLNSSDYGNLAFGIDGAALVYLGKHADAVTLAESAWLAGLLMGSRENPLHDEGAARARQLQVLALMREYGMITRAEELEAGQTPVVVRSREARQALGSLGFVDSVWRELSRQVGEAIATQGGLRVVTTIDLGLQLQVDCLARTYLARMGGGDPTQTSASVDGSPCAAASLLPPIRPGDVGVDHRMDLAAVVVIDPASGELLALSGPVSERRPAGSVLNPFVVLSAFSRGQTPGSMVVDGGPEGQGPMRLHTALAAGVEAVVDSLGERLGADVVGRTIEQMGIELEHPADALDGSAAIPLTDLTWAYAILANQGVAVGVSGRIPGLVEATSLREVWSADGRPLEIAEVQGSSILSEGLAYLMNAILADEAGRSPTVGRGTSLDPGRPAAVVTGGDDRGTVSWVVGYTPRRAVGVWVGAVEGEAMRGVHALNGAAPIWNAALRTAVAGMPPEAWAAPADVVEIEVCDPSGYLPTAYCPRTVKEVFLLGTEPTHPDLLFRPLRINRETGRLATFFTPLDQVEERVFFLPPEEAAAWASASGLETPPTEYDRIPLPMDDNPEVRLLSPEPFALIGGEVDLRGTAAGAEFIAYRVFAGQGLDPTAWLQIGEAGTAPVTDGLLGRWSTGARNGAYILRLTVERRDGSLETSAVPVTIDNLAPRVEVVFPLAGAVFETRTAGSAPIQLDVTDQNGVVRVVVFVDGRVAAELTGQPWSLRWPLGAAGEHVIRARAFDRAGNWAESDEVTIEVRR